MEAFNDIFEDCTSLGTKIPKDNYLSEGKYIVVDQGQNIIAGYTNEEDGLYEDVPAIVFGDHTRIIKYVDEPFFLGADGVKLLKSKKKDANYKYLYYALKNARIPDTGYNRHFKWLKEVNIEYPEPDKQQKIVEVLDKISRVIEERKLELQQLDELIKARFVEMFGDSVTNNMQWDMDTLLGVLEAGRTVTYGIVQTGDDVDEGIPVFRPIDIAGGHVPKREELKKTLPEISDKYKRTVLKGNELLITVRGSVGETFQVSEEFVGCNVGRNIVPLVTDKKRVNQRFLQELFAQKPIKDWIKAITKGIALQGLNMSEFKEMPVIVPEMRLQEEYVEFANQVDKSKVAVQKSLDETQTLFNSLMQEYFG